MLFNLLFTVKDAKIEYLALDFGFFLIHITIPSTGIYIIQNKRLN